MSIKTLLAGLASLTFCAAASALSIQAPTDSINTGVADWQVNGNNASQLSDIPGPWLSGPTGVSWIGIETIDASGGTYTFSLALGGTGGTFSLNYAADNTVQWSITNGSLMGTMSCLGNPDNCFGSGAGAPRSLTGMFSAHSILTATVVNGNSNAQTNPMGLLAYGTISHAAVPVPGSLALILIGTSAIAVVRARRKVG